MSEIQAGDEKIVEEAKTEYVAFLKQFEEKWGYGVGAISEPHIEVGTGVLRIETLMKLVKLPPAPVAPEEPAEDVAVEEAEDGLDTTPNGDTETTETSASDSSEQSKA